MSNLADFAPWVRAAAAALALTLGLVIVRWLTNLVLRRAIGAIARRTRTDLDDAIAKTMRFPLQLALSAMLIQAVIAGLLVVPDAWESSIDDGFFIAYALIATLVLWRLIYVLAEWYAQRAAGLTETELDEQLLPFIQRVALIGLLALMLIIVLGHFGVEVSGLVATLGVSSLVLGLAAQAALADTIAGFVIMVDRPFRIGDRIEILELETWGDVVDIGLRSSRIRTIDNRLVIVPNSVLGTRLIVNHTFPDSHYRIQVEAGVAYGTDAEEAKHVLETAAAQVEGVLPDHPTEALLLELGDSALVYRVRVWIRSYQDTRRIVDRLNRALYRALSEAGISIPFPQRTLHHRLDDVDPRGLAVLAMAARGEDQ
jgi:MscS family membrane protein